MRSSDREGCEPLFIGMYGGGENIGTKEVSLPQGTGHAEKKNQNQTQERQRITMEDKRSLSDGTR